jgi:putative ABC transport system ATP-binding protein
MNNPVIETENITKNYRMGDNVVKALNGVSFRILEGDFVSIIGASGSGKSTLLNIIGLLDRPSQGLIKLLGKDISGLSDDSLAKLRNQTIGFVFQQFNLLSRTSAMDNVLLPAWYNDDLDMEDARKRAVEHFIMFDLENRMDHFPNQLSGGEQQRVAIIRALICDPKIILADEPTGNLDSKSGGEIMDLLINLNKELKKTLILVSHNPQQAALAKKKIYLKDGKAVKSL